MFTRYLSHMQAYSLAPRFLGPRFEPFIARAPTIRQQGETHSFDYQIFVAIATKI